MLNKQQNLKMVKEGTLGSVRIIDQAMSSYKPVKPKKKQILALGIILGIFLGVIYVVVEMATSRGVTDSEQIEQQTGLSVFAAIPHSDLQNKIQKKISSRKGAINPMAGIHVIFQPDGIVTEAFRSMRTALMFASRKNANNMIIFSGPAPGLGKTFVSLNFAAIMAEAGKKVLLIDADMRRGHINEFVGIKQTPGLSELILGKGEIDQVAERITDNLSIIPTGERPPNPTELLMSDGFERLMQLATSAYEHVIIDTPPIHAVADANIIASSHYAGQVFLLVRSGQHPMREIKDAIHKFENAGVSITGVILNDVPMHSQANGSYYHYEYK
jgi:tyrosine-protein kinase Etk/Wzc